MALQDWLSDGTFKYTLKAPTVLDASELSRFLNVTKSGYCQQFSFAMAVLARLVGIPSRVAYGFTSGTPVGDDEWQVTTHDAHAWPELYFSGFGWLRFEPTPSGTAGQGTAYAPAYATLAGGASAGTSAPVRADGRAGLDRPAAARARRRSGTDLSEQLGDQGGLNQSEIGNPTPAAGTAGREPVGGVRAGAGRAGDPRAGGAVDGAAGDQAAALAPPQASRPAGPGGRRVGARGLERAQGRPGGLRRGLPAERHRRGRWRPVRARNWPWPNRRWPRSAGSPWRRSGPGTPPGRPTAAACGTTA